MNMKLTVIIVALILILAFSIIPINAAYYQDVQSSIDGYSILGIHVLNVTLHASGYSYSSSGKVTDLWLTDWAWFPNNIQNKKTWKASHPYGEYAKGSFTNVVGIPSPWGAIGLGSNTKTLSILF